LLSGDAMNFNWAVDKVKEADEKVRNVKIHGTEE
jgi:hypothetical protein